MRTIHSLTIILTSFLMFQSGVYACENYNALSIKEMKEYRNMLSKPDADPFDRMYAFDQLNCSDNPNLRNYAVKKGLKKSVDLLVRNHVLLKAMMQKKRIDVELSSNTKLTKHDKKFILQNAGVFSKTVHFHSEKDGCLSLYLGDRCVPESSLFIIGDKVEYNYRNFFGEFHLSQAGELIGFFRAGNNNRYSRIPAVIKLF